MNPSDYLVFSMNERYFALALDGVEKVMRAAALTPVPDAPAELLGLLNRHGEIIPVYDPGSRLGMPPRPLCPEDRFIIMVGEQRRVALVVEQIIDIVPLVAEKGPNTCRLFDGHHRHFSGVAKLGDKVVLIFDTNALWNRLSSVNELTAVEAEACHE